MDIEPNVSVFGSIVITPQDFSYVFVENPVVSISPRLNQEQLELLRDSLQPWEPVRPASPLDRAGLLLLWDALM
jgi:hypothetical protein